MKNKLILQKKRSSKLMLIVNSNMTTTDKLSVLVKTYGKFIGLIPLYLILIALSAVFIIPFVYMIGHSLMSVSDIMNLNIKWIPRSFNFNNYIFAFSRLNYIHYLLWTLLIVGLCVFGQVLSCSFVAYGLSRIKFKLNGLIFALVVFLLIVPPQTIIVPSLIMYTRFFHWDNTFLPIIVPCFFALGLNGGLMVFVFRQFFKSLPAELENAALIDGTGFIGAYFRVIFPNAKPAILITSILSLVWQWNNYFEPSVYIKDISNGSLTMQLQGFNSSLAGVVQTGVDLNQALNLAATFLTILPVLIIFFIIQRQFMASIASSGLAN
jgi:multiple sugar transport system permease protein